MGMKKGWIIGAVVAVAIPTTYLLVGVDVRPKVEYVEEVAEPEPDGVLLPPSEYGIPMAGFVLEQGQVRQGATFGDMLGKQGVAMSTVQALVDLAEPHFDVRRMRSGHAYAFIYANDSSRKPTYFVYEADPVEYVVFGLQDSLSVRTGTRPVVTTEHSISVPVTGALYNDLARADVDPTLAVLLSEVFAWTVDFYRIQKGDRFTMVYRQQTVDGEPYGEPLLLGVRYEGAKTQEAFLYGAPGNGGGYYDGEGKSLKKAFLAAPVKYSRISSGFSLRRFHPVQKRMKAHLGTDYAAPYGTPIQAVGDGVVIKAGYTAGNGKYVKIRHNSTYETQYLHMRKILVKQGQVVTQGQTIGEVGSTGLATGPHVCYRFWKNGRQVDPRKEVMPSADPLKPSELAAFGTVRDKLLARMDAATADARSMRVANF